jgi:hypothetical protein
MQINPDKDCRPRGDVPTAPLLLVGAGWTFPGFNPVYAIERQPAGYKLVFSGRIDLGEMRRWVDDSRTALDSAPASFGLLIDMRFLLPMSPDVRRLMGLGLQLFQRHGQKRTAIVVETASTCRSFVQQAMESGAYQWERYISAETTPDWETRGWAWVDFGLDPENPHADGLLPWVPSA